MKYDYMAAMVKDILDCIDVNDVRACLAAGTDIGELCEELVDELWAEDAVTGNGSGSYTFSAAQAAEYVSGNLDLLADALEDFGADSDGYRRAIREPEYADVIIRCYLLSAGVSQALEALTTPATAIA